MVRLTTGDPAVWPKLLDESMLRSADASGMGGAGALLAAGGLRALVGDVVSLLLACAGSSSEDDAHARGDAAGGDGCGDDSTGF